MSLVSKSRPNYYMQPQANGFRRTRVSTAAPSMLASFTSRGCSGTGSLGCTAGVLGLSDGMLIKLPTYLIGSHIIVDYTLHATGEHFNSSTVNVKIEQLSKCEC
jgi:hypothetical protein